MTPAGYMYKTVVEKPSWLKCDDVIDIYSVSGCVSEYFSNYINFWKHNGYWFFDSPQIMKSLANTENIGLSGTTLFYYEVYEYEFDDEQKKWITFVPEKDFVTNIQIPARKSLQGFDVVSYRVHTSPECSPLSCNSLASTIAVNQHCLFTTFEAAYASVSNGNFENSEPGPYRIFAVYKVDD